MQEGVDWPKGSQMVRNTEVDHFGPFFAYKSTLKNAYIRNKIAKIGQNGPQFRVLYAKKYIKGLKKYTAASSGGSD